MSCLPIIRIHSSNRKFCRERPFVELREAPRIAGMKFLGKGPILQTRRCVSCGRRNIIDGVGLCKCPGIFKDDSWYQLNPISKQMLYYLLVARPIPLSTLQLIDLLWPIESDPDGGPNDPANNVGVRMNHIRKLGFNVVNIFGLGRRNPGFFRLEEGRYEF